MFKPVFDFDIRTEEAIPVQKNILCAFVSFLFTK